MTRTVNRLFHVARALAGLLALAMPALAQQPTQAQISAIRSACRGDYQANCAGVPTGGQAALQCLQQHAGSVSPGCRNALKPLSEKPTQAQAAPEQPAATAAAPSPQLTSEGASLAAQEAATSAWPHTISRNGANVTIYQPQAIEWPGRQKLTARAAVAITPAGQSRPILGTIELTLGHANRRRDWDRPPVGPKLLSHAFPVAGHAAGAGPGREDQRRPAADGDA